MKPISQTPVKQRGAALAIGLILLAVTSLVTVTAINTGAMQERMSANQDNNARSFMAAEAGGASLISWIRTNGWPTVSNHPPLQSNVVAGDPSITFTLTLQSSSWANSPLGVLIEGRAHSSDGSALLARTQLLVELRRPPPAGGGPPASTAFNAPAAISCFGGPCSITAGAGQGADEGFGTVSGFDHPIPPLDCSGDGCRMQPQGSDRTMPAVPAVYLTNPTGSNISRSGKGNFDAFQGLNRAGTGIVRDNDMDVVRRPVDYPNDPATGTSTAPTLNSVFGVPVPPATSSVPTTTRLESGRTTLTAIGGSNFEVGTLVLNGEHLTMQGNALFVGLIVIRNCGTLRMGGNPNIYGAVVVDARRPDGTACPNYDPFGGAGTPALRYSLDALQRAANPPGSGGTGGGSGGATGVEVLRWTEFLQ